MHLDELQEKHMHWTMTDCQLAVLEDPLCPQRWTPIHAKISPLCHAGPRQSKLQKSFSRRDAWKRRYTDLEHLELTAGSGFLGDKIINAQSAGCTCMSICDSQGQETFRG